MKKLFLLLIPLFQIFSLSLLAYPPYSEGSHRYVQAKEIFIALPEINLEKNAEIIDPWDKTKEVFSSTSFDNIVGISKNASIYSAKLFVENNYPAVSGFFYVNKPYSHLQFVENGNIKKYTHFSQGDIVFYSGKACFHNQSTVLKGLSTIILILRKLLHNPIYSLKRQKNLYQL